MYRVEIVAMLHGVRPLSDDEVTDLIAAVVDELDITALAPSVGTARLADDLQMTVAVEVDENEEWEALAQAISTVRAAFRAAGIGPAGLTSRDLRSHVMPLQAA